MRGDNDEDRFARFPRVKATPPDSGEHEVMCVCGEDRACESYDGLCRDCWLGICACPGSAHPLRKWAIDPDEPVRDRNVAVSVPLPLAQRILAALEREQHQETGVGVRRVARELAALADELRKEMGK